MRNTTLLKISGKLIIFLLCFSGAVLVAQPFTVLSGAAYPFTNSGPAGYQGASFIDFDQDGDVDIYVGLTGLFRNDNGTFVAETGAGIGGQIGHSWADYDNDGDPDLFTAGQFSFLYQNNGDGTFAKNYGGALVDTFAYRGWSCAWGDINNDGFVDIAINHPAGFVQPTNNPTLNHLLFNDGSLAGTFSALDPNLISNGLQPYTVGTWSDYDQDGDMDYFIGSGPANGSRAVDFLYKNLWEESGSINFERITNAPIATDNQDGQVWNWIDYDNDGDLDAYLTNWIGALNRLYRNDGGSFTRVTGIPMVTDPGASLASIWGDFDNDGDLDCYVGNDNGTSDRYYRNDGDGIFTDIDNLAFSGSSTRRSGAAGDIDNDGDLDLLLSGPGANLKLYRNDTGAGNAWINIAAEGTRSNKSAIGARIRAKAQIGGKGVWQLREVSAQNSFNAQNDLRIHFGFGDATVIDSLRVEWPSGIVQVLDNIAVKQFFSIVEDSSLTAIPGDAAIIPEMITLAQNYPNPFTPSTVISYQLAVSSKVQVVVFDMLGREVKTLVDEKQQPGSYEIAWQGRDTAGDNVPTGVYFYRLTAAEQTRTRKMILLK